MREVPAVDVDHAVATVHLDDRRDERDHVLADIADVGALVDGETVGELHQRRRRSGLGRVDGAGDVVDRHRRGEERLGLGVVAAIRVFGRLQRARVGELGQPGLVRLPVLQVLLGRYGDDDPLAPLLALADGVHLDAGRRRRQHAEVAVHVGGVRQDLGRSRYVAEHRARRRHGRRGRQVVGQLRVELGSGRVLLDLRRRRLVDRLRSIGLEVLRQPRLRERGRSESR
jgi:hypothetical protein